MTKPTSPEELIEELGKLTQEGSSLLSYVTNIAAEGRALTRLITKATAPPDKDAKSINGEVWETVSFFCHPVELENSTTGELVKQVRVVLFDKDGRTFACVSGGVLNSLCMICQGETVGPWDGDPLPLVISAQATSRKRQVLRLEVAPEEPSKPKAGK